MTSIVCLRAATSQCGRARILSAGLLLPLLGFAASAQPAQTENPYEATAPAVPPARIDELVGQRLSELHLASAAPCSDAVFVRRVYLDVIGTLPTAAEVRQFAQDTRPDKRHRLIERLIARPEFTDYWTMKWCDLLRVKAEFPINLWPNAAQAYHRWIHDAVQTNRPLDRCARELLTANGSNFRDGAVNFYRALQGREPATIARTIALTFMGTRAEKWPAERLAGMAGFFSQLSYKSTGEWKEEIVYFDPAKPQPSGALAPVFPDGSRATIPAGRDPREVFAEWLVRPDNPWFARALANRAWSWLLGRGIVHETDDLRSDNPPANPALLAYLEHELVTSHFDLRHLFRLILNSQTYQRASVRPSEDPAAEANFAFYPLRRLEAEVLIDAINQITGTTENYSSAIPEPFTFIPTDQRAIALPDGSITSTFLEKFGRPARDTGLESERNNRLNPTQRLHLLNSTHIQRKLEQGPRLQPLLRPKLPPAEAVDGLYLAILSRLPTPTEQHQAVAYLRSAPATERRAAALDVAWALLNSTEFLYRH